MVAFNSVLLIGRLTGDPEVRMTPEGEQVCAFRLKVAESFKHGVRKRDRSTCIVHVEAWRGLAEACAQNLVRGREIFVLGKLRSHESDGESKEKPAAIIVMARSIQFLGRNGERHQQGS